MAVLLCTVVLLTREAETPESLITAIKTGSASKRWQKAFELSNELNQGRGMIRTSGVMKEVIHILRDRAEYDANPAYRHDAAMELVFGVQRRTTIVKLPAGYQQPRAVQVSQTVSLGLNPSLYALRLGKMY